MKKAILMTSAALLMCSITAFGAGKKSNSSVNGKAVVAQKAASYKLIEGLPLTDISQFPVDNKGFITIFDGKTFNGWRGYCRKTVPAIWTVDNGALRILHNPSEKDRGEILFAHKFKNFEFTFEWKVEKGSNSGIFYLVQEVKNLPAYCTAPEYQILDNVNHPDGKNGLTHQSAALYDMIPANPQNSKPYGEWNTGKIVVKNGKITHYQNGKKVVSYRMYNQKWIDLLNKSKFNQKSSPEAFAVLSNCGGPNHEGFIALQDHGDDVSYRNLKVKALK